MPYDWSNWPAKSVAMAAGIVLLVLGVFAGAVGQSTDSSLRFFPSALPMLIMARNVANIAVGLRISVVCGVLVVIAAGIDLLSAGSKLTCTARTENAPSQLHGYPNRREWSCVAPAFTISESDHALHRTATLFREYR